MRSIAFTVTCFLIFLPSAYAGHMSGFGDFGFGGRHYGFGGLASVVSDSVTEWAAATGSSPAWKTGSMN